MEIIEKPACIRDYELKTRVQEERCIKIKANRQAETNFTPIRHYQAYMTPNSTQKQRNKSNSKSLNADKKPPKDNYQELPSGVANSVTERNSYGLGYHNKQVDSRNQSFPICKRNQISNTKGLELVPYSRWLKQIPIELSNFNLN